MSTQKERYYLVVAKCGHVGMNNCVLKTLAVKGENGKVASAAARNISRVKHNRKMAIVSCDETDYVTYQKQFDANMKDPYFHCESRQEQKRLCPDLAICHDEYYLLHHQKGKRSQNNKQKATFKLKRFKETLLSFDGDYD